MSSHQGLRLRHLLSRSLPMDLRCPDGEALLRVGQAVRDLKAGRVNATANQGNR